MAGCFICHKDAPKENTKVQTEEVVVEKTALPAKKVYSYRSIPGTDNFAFDSKEPIPNDGKLDELMEDLKKSPNSVVYVEGHTDNMGSEEYNNKLSLERARAVKNALIEKGVSEEQIRVKGAGFKKPIASNETKEGRAQNRRVDVVLE